MNVVVASDVRLHRGPDGVVRSESDGRAHGFWSRYLEVFDSVQVLARVTDAEHTQGRVVEGDGVSVVPLPDFRGSRGLVRRQAQVRAAVESACPPGVAQVYLARVPGLVGGFMTAHLRRNRVPYALEVVGDPFAAMRSIAMPRAIALLLARFGRRQLQRQCLGAEGVSYVTERTLQRTYPIRPGTLTSSYSSVELPEGAYREPRAVAALDNPPTVVVVATMSQRYKGHHVLLRALGHLRDLGTPVAARLVGSGQCQRELEDLVCDLTLEDLVCFVGQLDTPQLVRAELDSADLFVLPSLTEGLPRALIEAMARGLPCVATSVGGVPELLPAEDLVAPGDHSALAERIALVIRDGEKRSQMAARNFGRAQDFHRDGLTARRNSFYTQLRGLAVPEQSGAA